MHACYKGVEEIVHYLFKFKDLDVNLTDHLYWSALFYACNRKHLEILSLLLDHPSIDPNTRNAFQTTVLVKATQNDFNEVVDLLLRHPKIDPNAQDDSGMTALMWASYRGNIFLVRKLLCHKKINPRIICTSDGKTAYDFAQSRHIKDILRPFKPYQDKIQPTFSFDLPLWKRVVWSRKLRNKIEDWMGFIQSKNKDVLDIWKQICQFLQKPHIKTLELRLLPTRRRWTNSLET